MTVNDRVAFCECCDTQREGDTTTFTYEKQLCVPRNRNVSQSSMKIVNSLTKKNGNQFRNFVATSDRCVFKRKVFQKLFKSRPPSACVHRVRE